jgi:hypothetical protein
MKHSARMRIERDGGWTSSDRVRPLDNRLHYPLMAEMQVVKDTQCQDCRFCMLAFSVPWNIFIHVRGSNFSWAISSS